MGEGIGYEVDFLPVGNGDRSGDAIAVRYGIGGSYEILVYDGGTKESGQALVDHIKQYYNSTTQIDYVINSHPDADHASGLSVVLKQLKVGELWLHQPWKYSSLIRDYFRDGRITDNSLAERLKEKMSAVYSLVQLAQAKNIPIHEPFQCSQIGAFTVLSPEQNWYVYDLIAEFQKSPEQKETKPLESLSIKGVLKAINETTRKAVSWVAENWGIETLCEGVETSAENESSVILYSQINGRGILLTGDAGVQALSTASEFANNNGISLPDTLRFLQVPHHGSRHNVSTSVLDQIVGLRKQTDDGNITKEAFVSVCEKSNTHPRKAVVNAFIRRGVNVFTTKGKAVMHRHNMPDRKGWVLATSLEFSKQVEEWD